MPLSRRETSKAKRTLAAREAASGGLRSPSNACAPPRDLAELGCRLNCCTSEGAASLAAVA